MRAGRQLPAQFEAAGLGIPDGTYAAVHFLPLSQMANMLIGVYDGLYAAGAELGLADPVRASAFRCRDDGGRRRWTLLLLDAGADRRLEAYWMRNAS
jgi:hypothetical protein